MSSRYGRFSAFAHMARDKKVIKEARGRFNAHVCRCYYHHQAFWYARKLFMSSAVCKIEILDFPLSFEVYLHRHGVFKTLFWHVYPISGISTSYHQLVPPFSLFLTVMWIFHTREINICFQWLMKGTTKLSCFMKSSCKFSFFRT